MSQNPVPYTEAEKLLASLMFEKAKASGRLKPAPCIAARITRSGTTHAVYRPTLPQDYARDARQLLSLHATGDGQRQWTRQDLERLLADR